MSDPVLQSIITGLVAITLAWIAWQQAKLAATVRAVAADVLKVEKATNSHTDLLVAATARAAHAEGKEVGRVEEEAKAKVDLSKGAVEPNDKGPH